MSSVPIRFRLTEWYFAGLAAILSLFGLNAYLAMRNSAYEAVDEELRDRADGVRRLIERASEYGPENCDVTPSCLLVQTLPACSNRLQRQNWKFCVKWFSPCSFRLLRLIRS